MKALVTGGAGFIGSHIVRTLLNENYEVRVLHLSQEKLTNLEGLDVELIAGDITDPAKMDEAVSGCDLVFHTAAIYALWLPKPELMRKVNVKEHEPYSMLQKRLVLNVLFTPVQAHVLQDNQKAFRPPKPVHLL